MDELTPAARRCADDFVGQQFFLLAITLVRAVAPRTDDISELEHLIDNFMSADAPTPNPVQAAAIGEADFEAGLANARNRLAAMGQALKDQARAAHAPAN